MKGSLRGFALAVCGVWAVLVIAAILYSRDQGIPNWIGIAVVPAFLVEVALYMAAGFESVRERLRAVPPVRLAALMTLAAPVPYAIYTTATALFDWRQALGITALAAVASFWYVLLPKRAAADLAFLVLMAAIVLLKLFPVLYPSPMPRLELHVLGAAMWVRTGMLAVLSLRGMEGIGFSFLPQRRDWAIGLQSYLLFLPVGVGLAVWLGFVGWNPKPFSLRLVLVAVATFFGMLWVVALSEEFFFRGLLQQVMARLMRSDAAGLAIAAVVFGLVHLPFRSFPNWKFVALATLAGLFYGLAFQRAGSIRAAMVAHALVNTTWRVFLS